MMAGETFASNHVTVWCYAPELNRRSCRELCTTASPSKVLDICIRDSVYAIASRFYSGQIWA
jgi:hypothetical protein